MTNPQYWVQFRGDVAQNWFTYNPVLRAQEIGIETDTGRAKMGDGVSTWNALTYWNPAGAAVGADAAPLVSPAFSGTPTAPTAASGTSTTQLATTAFVAAALSGISGSVSSVFGRTGAVTAQSSDYSSFYDSAGSAAIAQSDSETFATSAVTTERNRAETAEGLLAPLASPAFTGNPTAPTQTTGDNSTKLATTAFVAAALTNVGAGSVSTVSVETANGFSGTVADATTTPEITLGTMITGLLKGNGSAILEAVAGTDYLSPTGSGSALTGITQSQVSGSAPLASPAFTGTPTAPTASAGTDDTQIATTAFVAAAVAAGGGSGSSTVPGMNVIWMDNEGVSNTGASSVTTEFNTLLTAQDGDPCVFVFGVGTYLWSTAPDALGPGQSVIGLGPTVTNFTWSGAGPLFTATTAAVSGTWDGSLSAGTFAGFTINGPYGTDGTAGIKYGALQSGVIDNVFFYGLDGGCIEGYQVTSGVDWAEEWQITRLNVSGCGATSGYCFQFSTTSFDYSRLDAVVVVEANIDVLALNDSAEMQGLEFHCRGNLHGGTTNTGALISLDRTTASGSSVIGGSTFSVSMEGDDTSDGGSGTVGHYLLYMGSSNAASQFQANGVFNVYNAGAEGQGIYNPNYLPVSFSGLMNSGTAQMLDGEALVVYGGMGMTTINMGFSALGTGTQTLYNEFSDAFSIQLTEGDVTIQFDAASNFVRKYTFLFKNPASGDVTITWPANWYFALTENTFSAAENGITKVECLYDPVSDIYYAEVVGSGYATSSTTTITV